MAIYQWGAYRVRAEGVAKVKAAIREFVAYVQENEPGTEMYLSWQEQDDPTRFHFPRCCRAEAAWRIRGSETLRIGVHAGIDRRRGRVRRLQYDRREAASRGQSALVLQVEKFAQALGLRARDRHF